jgi:hypothetical protein
MKTYKPIKLNNNPKTRDYLMVRVICGATKAGTHKDLKKDQNRRACRNFREECA